MTNALYYGDNLTVLRESIATESVDLIYLDPPFNSRSNYYASPRYAEKGKQAGPVQRADKRILRCVGKRGHGRDPFTLKI